MLAVALLAPSSTAASSSSVDALSLLRNAGKQYKEAVSYHIEAVEERSFSDDLERSWQKRFLTAIVAPSGRYRYEGRARLAWAILVSDGRTHWDFHFNEHLYTETPASVGDSEEDHTIPNEEIAVSEAPSLISDLRTLPNRLKSATFLSDQTIELTPGRKIDCYVVGFGDGDLKTRNPHFKTEETVWIDKSHNIIVKTYEVKTFVAGDNSDAKTLTKAEQTMLYPVTKLGEQEPESSFGFSTRADAKLVKSFPESQWHTPEERRAEFLGKKAPNIRLKAADGTITTLSSFLGKPVFLEFWATWCAPCVDLVPDLKDLHDETAAKGLAWIGIDNDEDPDAATTFLSEEHVAWPNFHDGDGTIGGAFGREGIPLGVVVDANGRIVFYKAGYEISEVRSAIAKLGFKLGTNAPMPASK